MCMLEKFGIGIDVVNVNSFRKKPYSIHTSFYEKIFQESEIKYCLKHKDCAKHFAGKFAIKEAVIKSISDNVKFLDIETSHSNSKPIVTIRNFHNYRFLASLSHEENIAIGVVISEKIS